MEINNTDNLLENYFFELILKKEITKHALKEVYEVLIKANDDIEDDLERASRNDNPLLSIDFSNNKGGLIPTIRLNSKIAQYLFWKYESLEWIQDDDRIYIWKLFFGIDFSDIEHIHEHIQVNMLGNIQNFRSMSLEKKWLVFHIIFSIIENLLNLEDEEFVTFLMNQQKETLEIDLLYIIEKALKLFEVNARYTLLSFQSILEKIHSDDFLTDDELQQFKAEVILLSDGIIEEYKTQPIITDSIKKFEQIRNNFKKMR